MEFARGAMSSLLPKLGELILEEYNLQKRLKRGIKDLMDELLVIQAALEKVSEVPLHQLDPLVKIWANDVRELSYAIEDSLDSFMVRVEGLEPTKPHTFLGFIKKTCKKATKLKIRREIANIINDVKIQLREVKDRYDRYKDSTGSSNAKTEVDPRLLTMYSKVSDIIGIDNAKDELMKMLFETNGVFAENLKVVSVVGFGGLGKTTLAKVMYGKLIKNFDCGGFVPVGQNPDTKKVLRDILLELDTELYKDAATMDERQLINQVKKFLTGKRYLIVIDDMWNENLWEHIKDVFSNENNLGSRIIITTRIISVSKACCLSANDSIYQMKPLSGNECKNLLHGRIFGSKNSFPDKYKQLSSDILKKCGGVPLAIIAFASVLADNPSDKWHALLKSIGHGLTNECWENMQMIISFSYSDLPPHLKTCCLYLSTFPVTRMIEKDRLVKKIIAEGIVTQKTKPSEELSLEEVASKYLDELVNRNVIHPLECNNNGEVITYHIHPMMHHVLKDIATEEKFAALLDGTDISRAHGMTFRRLSIDCPDLENLNDLSSMAFHHGVRSLTIFGHAKQILLRHFEDIRLLDLEGCKSIERAELECICSMVQLKRLCLAKTPITELPPQIGKLQYLEGLDVGGTHITQLPTQIGKLQHLKRLDARKSQVKGIPDDVLRLTRLVHLLIGDNESCEGVQLPDGIGKMTSLEQLCTIDLRKCSISSLKELGKLPHLKEIAVVAGDDPRDTRMNNALLSSLDKSNLRSLVVYSDFRLSTLQPSSPYKYLNCLKKLTVVRRSLKVPICIAGHRFLGMLDIRVCKLEDDDLKILRELPRLQSLIVRLEVLPTKMLDFSSEGFAKLESFYVDCRMPMVVFEEGAMPKLEHLELKLYGGSASEENMGIKHLLSLQKVTVWYSKWYATNKGVRDTTEAMKTESKEHQNEITLCIAEEDKDGTSTMETEFCQENKDAGCSKMIEIEEEDKHTDGAGYFLNNNDTQEVNFHQSSCDIASCSGTNEIEEVVE